MASLAPIEAVTSVAGYQIDACGGKYFFDGDEAARRIAFVEKHVRHSVGAFAGQRFKLSDWQRDAFAAIHGWRKVEPIERFGRPYHQRRFSFVFLFLPRKNGKTFLSNGLTQTCLYQDGEPGAELLCTAASR